MGKSGRARLILWPLFVCGCAAKVEVLEHSDGAANPIEHNIVEETCASSRYSRDFVVDPWLECDWKPGSRNERVCAPHVECLGPQDCAGNAFVRCVGSGSITCVYPVPKNEVCQSNSDCKSLPDGECMPASGTELLCTPEGECKAQTPYCVYPATWATCETDADCTVAAGGYCKRSIGETRCNTSVQCFTDLDCPSNQRCACGNYDTAMICVNAECRADRDCGISGLCLRSDICGYGGTFNCSTANDECHSNQDCASSLPGASCLYNPDDLRWRCTEVSCESP